MKRVSGDSLSIWLLVTDALPGEMPISTHGVVLARSDRHRFAVAVILTMPETSCNLSWWSW